MTGSFSTSPAQEPCIISHSSARGTRVRLCNRNGVKNTKEQRVSSDRLPINCSPRKPGKPCPYRCLFWLSVVSYGRFCICCKRIHGIYKKNNSNHLSRAIGVVLFLQQVSDSQAHSFCAVGSAYSVTLSRCQISSTYCCMVLSEVNLPEHATLRIALFAQPSVLRYAASTFF